jgi:hypothetical protein
MFCRGNFPTSRPVGARGRAAFGTRACGSVPRLIKGHCHTQGGIYTGALSMLNGVFILAARRRARKVLGLRLRA